MSQILSNDRSRRGSIPCPTANAANPAFSIMSLSGSPVSSLACRKAVCRCPPAGPIRYVGHDKLRRDLENLKAAMVAAGADEGFMPASAPITALQNDYYATEEEFITAYGDAMREESQAILDAGLILQIDFPMLVSRWDTASRTMSLADYRKWAEGRIAYLSHALRGLPEDRIRFHTCYGVNFGPRVSDLQLENILDLIFTIP